MAEYYSDLIGKRNYQQILSPFLAAVPSQNADDFPVSGDGSLFKTRERAEQYPRSYGFHGGLQVVCDKIVCQKNIELKLNHEILRIKKDADHFEIETTQNASYSASHLILASSPNANAQILGKGFEDLAGLLRQIPMVEIDSVGVVLPADKTKIPSCAFIVAVDDVFYSAVTRDPFPNENSRSFTFHFKKGLTLENKLKRISEVLDIEKEEFKDLTQKTVVLPSPKRSHRNWVKKIDELTRNTRLGLTGNYFGGLAIEDCILRSLSEAQRLTAMA